MKKAGQPWEKAKGFDNSCPISGFIPAASSRRPAEYAAEPEG
jgi:2-keto-4-pentenoate hydratase/2-oxohepta-3-ene-1,7-dioic acid hydratase in catechol pathway